MKADQVTLNSATTIAKLPEPERTEAIKRVLASGDKKAAKKLAGQITRRSVRRATVLDPSLPDPCVALLQTVKDLQSLPKELWSFCERKVEYRLTQPDARELRGALTSLCTMDFHEVVDAADATIGELNKIIKDPPDEKLPIQVAKEEATQ